MSVEEDLDKAIDRLEDAGGLPALERDRTLLAFTNVLRRLSTKRVKIVKYAEEPGAELIDIDLNGLIGVAVEHREMLGWLWVDEPPERVPEVLS